MSTEIIAIDRLAGLPYDVEEMQTIKENGESSQRLREPFIFKGFASTGEPVTEINGELRIIAPGGELGERVSQVWVPKEMGGCYCH